MCGQRRFTCAPGIKCYTRSQRARWHSAWYENRRRPNTLNINILKNSSTLRYVTLYGLSNYLSFKHSCSVYTICRFIHSSQLMEYHNPARTHTHTDRGTYPYTTHTHRDTRPQSWRISHVLQSITLLTLIWINLWVVKSERVCVSWWQCM